MSYAGQALQKAYDYYRTDCERYGIEINPSARVILFNGKALRYEPYTTERIYRMELRRLIKASKERAAEKANAKQGRLL